MPTILAWLLLGSLSLPTTPAIASDDAPDICPERWTITKDGIGYNVPYCSNRTLGTQDAQVRRLLIVIHGDTRNAIDQHRYVLEAAADGGFADALVVAPQFLVASDLTTAPLSAEGLYWSDSGWKQGDASLSGAPARPWSVSSFAIIDELIEHLADPSIYPSLAEVVVLGHSAGGQFVGRYGAIGRVSDQVARRNIGLRYVVANPSSYLYLDGARLKATGFAPLTETERADCHGYDRYKYGLEQPNQYATDTGMATVRAQFIGRHVTYLLGELDVDKSDPTLDSSCAAEWQGAHRLERGLNYHAYLRFYYGSPAHDLHRLVRVPDVGHQARAMFRSAAARPVLFPVLSDPSPTPGPSPTVTPTPTPTATPTSTPTPTATPEPTHTLVVDRVSGTDRFATAAQTSKQEFSAGVPVVFIATGANFPDALAGGPAAGKSGGPVLLVNSGSIPSATVAELKRLEPKKIFVLGGPGAIGSTVLTSLRGYTSGSVIRLSGSDRYATAAAISATHFSSGAPVVYIATGANFPDALAGVSPAGRAGGPILLSSAGSLPPATIAELKRLQPKNIVVLGGSSVLSNNVLNSLRGYASGSVTRLAGADRYATAVAISNASFSSASTVYLATGSNYPDALAGGPVAALRRAPLLLTPASHLPASVKAELLRLNPSKVVILGGTAAVSDAVLAAVKGLLD